VIERLTVHDRISEQVLEVVHRIKAQRTEFFVVAQVSANRKRNLTVSFHDEVNITHLESIDYVAQRLRRAFWQIDNIFLPFKTDISIL